MAAMKEYILAKGDDDSSAESAAIVLTRQHFDIALSKVKPSISSKVWHLLICFNCYLTAINVLLTHAHAICFGLVLVSILYSTLATVTYIENCCSSNIFQRSTSRFRLDLCYSNLLIALST